MFDKNFSGEVMDIVLYIIIICNWDNIIFCILIKNFFIEIYINWQVMFFFGVWWIMCSIVID